MNLNDQNLSKAERSIATELANILSVTNGEYSSSVWTKKIKKMLYGCAKAINPNYLVASNLKECSDNPEWLYDVVWYEMQDDGGLRDIHLIVESEWKNGNKGDNYAEALQYDFEKLIVGRSALRLMIFEADNIDEAEGYVSILINVAKKCILTQKSDRYMFAVWNCEKQAFYFDFCIL